jgi:triacylglycerol lipase
VGIVWLALLALLLVGAAVAGALWWRRRARARIEPADFSGVTPIPGPIDRGPPLPVVLVHGMFGFDRIGVPLVKLHYFRGIVRHLARLGVHAHAVRLPAVASVPERAKILVDAIAALPHERVDIIAHSLGGLDARYALAKLGLASRVRALVTIGTPHRGTPIADLATDGPLALARKALAALGMPMDAADWLSTSALARFNEEIRDVPGVRYACVVGGIRNPSTPIPLAISPIHAYLRRVAGPNDGLVPMSSQYWGETLAEIEADHWEQVGWRLGMPGVFDALAMYEWIVARLGDGPQIALPVAVSA